MLAELLAGLPPRLDAAVLIAQHVDEAYARGLMTWLGQRAALPVEMASAGIVPKPGRAYLAASDAHLVVGGDGKMRYTPEPAGWYRPSVDALFQSVARSWTVPGCAALLTGMGTDGAAGMLALKRAGWHTIAQDRTTSVVWGMPGSAAHAGVCSAVLPIGQIAPKLVRVFAGDQP